MLGLTFAAPLVLLAAPLLYALYRLLRVTPPQPMEQRFPPLRLLIGLASENPTPHRTPWPILLLRLLAAALVILAASGPQWSRTPLAAARGGTLVLAVDDGWPAARDWPERIAYLDSALEAADKAGRPVALALASQAGVSLTKVRAADARAALHAAQPQPIAPERAKLAAPVAAIMDHEPDSETLWLADGMALGGADDFARALSPYGAQGRAQVVTGETAPLALNGVDNAPAALKVSATRAPAAPSSADVRALDSQGREIARRALAFGSNASASADFDIPIELRNDIAEFSIDGQHSAGATWLIDDRWRRKRVALAEGAGADTDQPLVSPLYFLRRALAPTADLTEAAKNDPEPIRTLLARAPSALILADMALAPGKTHDSLADYVAKGGVLVRFAGTRLAAAQDDLTPVRLRRGGRNLGGALSWDTPKHVADFDKQSPFFGLAAPQEVTVSRQVLAEPDDALDSKVWARLADGTPLVTAAKRGKGLIVLFHVTADTTWSNLPISGLFVDMLDRVVAYGLNAANDAQAQSAEAAPSLPPLKILDGYGALGAPPANAEPLPSGFAGAADMRHPPGLYGAGESVTALNALQAGATLKAADYGALPVKRDGLAIRPPIALAPWLWLAALIAFLADGAASLALSRTHRAWKLAGVALAGALALGALAPQDARAAGEPWRPALDTSLGYVLTGDSAVDAATKAGMESLTAEVDRRTAAELADPVALDPAKDELAYYPMIYWPVAAGRPQPASGSGARIAAYMRDGGTIVFDTRDALTARDGGPPTPEALWLRKLLDGVDVPELEPLARDHVATKTFYLIDNFIGRTDNGQTWIEALPPVDPADKVKRPVRAGDGVSPIILVSNDLAAAWASDDAGRALYPLIPGGPRQREFAIRGGVNLVLYTLTGNYKADQVHAKDLIERLSH